MDIATQGGISYNETINHLRLMKWYLKHESSNTHTWSRTMRMCMDRYEFNINISVWIIFLTTQTMISSALLRRADHGLRRMRWCKSSGEISSNALCFIEM